MSLLLEFDVRDASRPRAIERDESGIAARLATESVRFERWAARAGEPLRAYAAELAQLASRYPSADVVQLRDPPPEQAAAARAKFLHEHRHDEDEVRFFVEGAGMFALRFDERVLLVHCQAGDLISVPAGTCHWFDMGARPHFCALRMFGSEAGWVATFTGDEIAQRFPSFDALRERWP